MTPLFCLLVPFLWLWVLFGGIVTGKQVKFVDIRKNTSGEGD